MKSLQAKPLHIRRRIALLMTIGIGVVLLSVLIIRYTKTPSTADNAKSRWTDFYTTILSRGQSLFSR